jgi:hypothetical protein
VIEDLAYLVEHASDLKTDASSFEGRLKSVTNLMGMPRAALLRLVGKLADLRKAKFMKNIVEIRGCNLAAQGTQLLQAYRRALGTHMLSAPVCRQLYLPINPDNPALPTGKAKRYLQKQKTTMQELSQGRPPNAKSRRRLFGRLGSTGPEPLIIDVEDIDGHTNVTAHPFMDHPSKASEVAPTLILNWNQAVHGTHNDKFILPVMWDNNEASYHVPLEDSYNFKIKIVTY